MIDVPHNILVLITLGIGVLALGLGVWVVMLENRIKKLTRGKDGASLEATINDLITVVENVHSDQESAKKERALLNKKAMQSIQGIGVVRFNPFKDSGGNQSFAIAMLDEHGNGAVISTLFSRERMSIFGKPIEEFSSKYDLSTEEAQAVAQAQEKLS